MAHGRSPASGFTPLGVLLILGLIAGGVAVSSAGLRWFELQRVRQAVDLYRETTELPGYLDEQLLGGAELTGDVLGIVALDEGYSAYRVLEASLAGGAFTGDVLLRFPNGEEGRFAELREYVDPFMLRDGSEKRAAIIDPLVTGLSLLDGRVIPLRLVEASVRNGKLAGLFKAQTYVTNHLIVGELDAQGSMQRVALALGGERRSDISYTVAKTSLGFSQDRRSALRERPRVLGEAAARVVGETLTRRQDLQELPVGPGGEPFVTYDAEKGTWAVGGAFVDRLGFPVTRVAEVPAIESGSPGVSVVTERGVTTIAFKSEALPAEFPKGSVTSVLVEDAGIQSEDLAAGSVTTAAIADGAVTAAKIKDGEVGTAEIDDDAVTAKEIAAGAVGTSEIADGSITNSDIADDAAISDGKLAQITSGNKVSGSAVQLASGGGVANSTASGNAGLSLLRTCSTDQTLSWNGTSWGCSTAGSGSGDITGVTAGSGLTGGGDSGAVTLTVGTGTGITVNADDIAVNQAFTPTWTGAHTFSAGATFSSGLTVSAGALAVNSDSITADGATLTINAAGAVDVQDALTADSLTSDAGVTIAAAQSYTGSGAVTVSSGGTAGLTLDSASNTLTIASSDTALTASGVTTLTLGAGASIVPASAGALTVGNSSTTALTVTTDATGDAEVTLPSGSISGAEILDATVLTGDLGTDTILAGNIATGAVATAEILDDTVGTDDIAADTIAAGDIATGGVATAEILNDTIDEDDLDVTGTDTAADEECLTFESTGGTGDFEWQSCGSGGSSAWSALTDPSANLTLEHTSSGTGYTTAFNWTDTTSSGNFFTLSLDNNGGTAGTDQVLVISNAASTATTGDLNTEALLLLDQADTTTTGTTAVDDALLITNSGGSTLTDAIQIGTGSQVITNAINIASTGVTTDILLQNGESISNDTDGTIALGTTTTLTADGALTLSSGGSSGLTLDSASNTLTVASSDTTLTATGLTTVSLGAGVSITSGSGAMTLGSSTTTAITLSTDATGDAEVTLPSGSISGAEILDATVLTGDLGTDTIVAGNIATGAVATAEILDGTIDWGDIANATTLDAATTIASTVAGTSLDLNPSPAGTATAPIGLEITPTWGIDVADQTLIGLNINAATNGNTDAGDVLQGIVLAAITATAGTETAITIGSGWDTVLDSNALDISGAGAVTGATGVTSSGTITFSGLVSCDTIDTNGSGVLACGADAGAGASPFGSAGGVITKNTVTDFLSLRYGDAADIQLEVENTTSATIPTADAVSINLSGGTTGIVTGGVDGLYILMEVSDIAADGTISGAQIDIDTVGTPTAGDIFVGLNVAALNAATSGLERAIQIGDTWDAQLFLNDTTSIIQLVDASTLTFEDASGNDIFVLSDVSTATNHTLTGDADTGLVLSGMTTDITTGTNEALTITANGTGDITLSGDADTDVIFSGSTTDITTGTNEALTVTANGTGDITLSGDADTDVIFSGGTTDITTGTNEALTITANGTGDITLTGDADTDVIFSGGTTDITTGTNEALTITANGTGNIVLSGDADTVVSLTSAASLSEDQLALSGGSTVTTDIDALSIAFTQADDADATDTNALLNLAATSSSLSADTLRGVNIAAITAGAASETALVVGSGWDTVLDSNALDISGAGAVTGATGVTSSGTITFSGLVSCDTINTDAGGVLSCGTDAGGNPTSITLEDTTANDLGTSEADVLDGTFSITLDSTTQRVLLVLSIEVEVDGTDDETSTFRLRRGTDCLGTQVGTDMTQFTTLSASDNWYIAATFVDAPAATSQAYNVCGLTSTATTPNNAGDIRITATEVAAAGADLAEVYYTRDDAIESSDVVVMDPTIPAGAKKSTRPYDPEVLGIVSTKPGATLDDAVGLGYGKPVPVALVGRVPAKVTTENGSIQPGDFLTTSSTPGVAMKATKAGPIVGQAMTSYEGEGVGTVLVFVKTTFSQGSKLTNLFPGLTGDVVQTPDATSTPSASDFSQAVLTELISGQGQLAEVVSEILTDRLAAAAEIITPAVTTAELTTGTVHALEGGDVTFALDEGGRIVIAGGTGGEMITFDAVGNAVFAGTVTADRIRANQIEGLEIFTDRIGSLAERVKSVETARTWDAGSVSASGAPGVPTPGASPAIAADPVADGVVVTPSPEPSETPSPTPTVTPPSPLSETVAFKNVRFERGEVVDVQVLGTLTVSGVLRVEGKSEFAGDVLFGSLAEFGGNVVFAKDVTFEGRPTFNTDTGGHAVIRNGASRVDVTFSEEYAVAPIVNVTMTFDEVRLPDGSVEDPAIREQRIFRAGYSTVVSRRTPKGFSVILNKAAEENLTFSWMALAVREPRVFESAEVASPSPIFTPTPSPEPTGGTPTSPSPSSADSSLVPLPSAEPTPPPSPAPSPTP